MYDVHIIPVGTNPKPAISVMQSKMPVRMVCLLCSEELGSMVKTDIQERLRFAEIQVDEVFRKSDVDDVRTIRVDPWDYQGIINEVIDTAMDIRSSHQDAVFHINFTSGTHVMCGAVCSAAFYIGADLYYIMNRDELMVDDPVRHFTIPNFPDVSRIKGNTRQILFLMEGGGWKKNEDLMTETGLTPSKLGYHTRVLLEYDLIERHRDGRKVCWRLTESGRVAVKVMSRPLVKRGRLDDRREDGIFEKTVRILDSREPT